MTGLVIGRYVISRQKTLVCGRQIRNDYLQKTDTYRPITRPDQSIIPSTDCRTGCRNVSHYQQQQSCSGLRSPGRSNSTYFWNDSWVQTFHSKTSLVHDSSIDSSGSQSDRTSSFKIEFKMSFKWLESRGDQWGIRTCQNPRECFLARSIYRAITRTLT